MSDQTNTMNAIYSAGKVEIGGAKFINIRKANHDHELHAVATHDIYGNKLKENSHVVFSIWCNRMSVFSNDSRHKKSAPIVVHLD